MAVEPTYNIYPIIEFSRVQDSFEEDGNFAGSLGNIDEGTTLRKVSSRKGAFIIGFTENYGNPSDNTIAFTFEQETQSSNTYKKRYINIFLAQHQFADIGSNDGAPYVLSRAVSTRFYNLKMFAYTSTQSELITEEVANSDSFYAASSTHYYPLDFTNCLGYNINEYFTFQITPLLDNNGSTINNNTLFKGYYIIN